MSVLKLFDLTGQTAVVTGGGRGLGRQIAIGLAEAGANIVLCSRRVENCEEVKRGILEIGREAIVLPLDVRDPESIRKVAEESIKHFGKIEILVNNSGATWGAPAVDMPLEAWNKVIETNLTGTFLMCQAFGRHMIENGYGKIVNIASAAGLRGADPRRLDAVGYTASKGGVIILTKDLGVKWGPYGVYVNAVAPGFFPSKMTKDVLAKVGDKIIDNTPLRKVGGDRDLMGAVLYFASAASNFCTGQTLAVDGGTSAM